MTIYGTTHRGKVKIRSKKQIRFLEARKLPYTRYVRQHGKLRKVRRNVRDPKRGLTW